LVVGYFARSKSDLNYPANPTESPISVLIVVAHPDDEVLGCGGTAAIFAAAGRSVRACILSGEVAARAGRPQATELRDDTLRAQEVLGLGRPIVGEFPNIAFNTVPQLELVQFIEAAILETKATTVITHHGRDLNNDHLHVSLACQAAIRLPQRRSGIAPIGDLLFMEVLSSTDWSVPDGRPGFDPDTFMPLTDAIVEKKLTALACYRGVMRPHPHPRSVEAIRALALLRGAQCGVPYAESFVTGCRIFRQSPE
jgi:LmbE family N-acetylglucosaminyl deacetylase